MEKSHLRLQRGDIVLATEDAIVNAANPKMLGGGGVDGAIHRAAGPKLLEECRKVPRQHGIRCPVGESRITGSGELKSRWVIHTVGPRFRYDDNPAKLLQMAYASALSLAREYGCESVAFPAISCGAYGYPQGEAAYIALSECKKDKWKGMDIVFYLYDDSSLTVWTRVCESML